MSLKEEIKEIVIAIRYEWKKNIIENQHPQIRGIDEYTDDIMKLIEKRIDNVKTMLPGGNYEIDLKYLLIEGIKQEILK